MAEVKTKPTDQPVADFISALADEKKQADAHALVDLMRNATEAEPVMWGTSIIGFGSQPYKYASGREGEWPILGFSPRKSAISLYGLGGPNRYPDLLAKLGKYRTGKRCVYIKRLSDVEVNVLKKLFARCVADGNEGC